MPAECRCETSAPGQSGVHPMAVNRPCSIANSVAPARVVHAGLGVDVLDVAADGLGGDAERHGDLLVGASTGDQAEHLDLAVGETGWFADRRGPTSRRPPPARRRPPRRPKRPCVHVGAQLRLPRRRGSARAMGPVLGHRVVGVGGGEQPGGEVVRRRGHGGSRSRRSARGGSAARSASGTSSWQRRRTRSLRYGWSRTRSHCAALSRSGMVPDPRGDADLADVVDERGPPQPRVVSSVEARRGRRRPRRAGHAR